MLNVAEVTNNEATAGSSKIKSVTGNAGIRIDFSWTWNESKKKDKEVFTIPYISDRLVGRTNSIIVEGRKASIVAAVLFRINTFSQLAPRSIHFRGWGAFSPYFYLNLTSCWISNNSRNFTTIFTAHHTLATLSWYSPRKTGNIRWITCKISGKVCVHGANNNPKVIMTVDPSFTSFQILGISKIGLASCKDHSVEIRPSCPSRLVRITIQKIPGGLISQGGRRRQLAKSKEPSA